MFYHGFGYGPHIGFFGGGFSFIIMFLIFMFVLSILRHSFYGGYRGYRGYRRYQRPYQPYDPKSSQSGQDQEGETPAANRSNDSQYYGYGNPPSQTNQDDTGVKTVRTGNGAGYSEQRGGSETGTPTQRVDNPPGGSGEPTRPL
jgi:hypothetical protein